MKHPVVRAALTTPGLTPGQRVLLAILADFANTNAEAWPSRETLSNLTGQHPKSIQTNLTALRRLGYLTVTKRAQPGRTLTVKLHPDRWPRPP